uniref:B box-type domain-containing protein n=1 Tax=Nelumbo nucifera TaxID=4432 RepID=A0A822ZTR4_NELNU|nr:TPA_asm: hypothetical protein HUJ06_016858 [Nelumbo nucifera]
MKIQCDVCNQDEASLFCSADEAALCDGCDRRVHHANKLAGKHLRFSLLHPSFKETPRCDVCQERRAFLFCQEDRAILCRECDLPIHTANEQTKKHNRFLLTGVKLSPSSSLYSTTNSSINDVCDSVKDKLNNSKLYLKKKSVPLCSGAVVHPTPPVVEKPSPPPPPPPPTTTATITTHKSDDHPASGGGSTSSISEYLIKMLPGWQVEDFLDSYSAPHGFCKDMDLENSWSFAAQDITICVPQVPQASTTPYCLPNEINFENGFKEASNQKTAANKRWRDDGGFTVPQISPPSCKRSTHFW